MKLNQSVAMLPCDFALLYNFVLHLQMEFESSSVELWRRDCITIVTQMQQKAEMGMSNCIAEEQLMFPAVENPDASHGNTPGFWGFK